MIATPDEWRRRRRVIREMASGDGVAGNGSQQRRAVQSQQRLGRWLYANRIEPHWVEIVRRDLPIAGAAGGD